MAEVTRQALRLLIVPDARTVLSTDGVSMTATSEAGPRPGPVLAAQTSIAEFSASGTLDNDLVDLEFGIARSGGPGAAEVRWRHAGEGMRSWDPPTAISEWEFVARGTTANRYASPHAVRRSTGRLVIVASADTDADTVADAIVCYSQTTTGTWTSATVASVATSIACITELPSGRLICVWTSGGTTSTQLQMGYSDDGGATWTVGSYTCLTTPIAQLQSTITRIRMAVVGSDVLLLLWGTTIDCYQYVSGDLGATFAPVEEGVTGTSGRRCPDIAVRGGVAYCGFIGTNADDANRLAPLVLQLTTARTSIVDAPEVWAYGAALANWTSGAAAETSSWSTGNTFAIVADDDGILWTYGRDNAGGATQETIITCSVDGGVTWRKPWKSSATGTGLNVTSWGTATSYLTALCAVPERGRVALIHTATLVTATDGPSLMAAYLGGWSTVGLPHDSDLPRVPDVGGWDTSWIGCEKPDLVGWTRTVGGAPTEVLGSSGLTLTQAGGERQVFTRTLAGLAAAPNAGIFFAGQVAITSGQAASISLRTTDATNDYSIRLEISTTGLRIYDVAAGAYIAAETTATTSNGVIVMICVDAPNGYVVGGGRVRCWYRGAGIAGPNADRQWTAVTGSTTLTRSAVGVALTEWGQTTAAAGVSVWRWVGASAGTYVAGRNGLADPTRGRMVPDRTSPIHIEDGLRLAMVTGPALIGEIWTHATAHDYPVEALDVTTAPSPRQGWRATGETQQDIVITCDAGFRAGDLLAIYIAGANFPTCTLYQDAGMTKVADCDLTFTGLDFTRSRDILYPSMSGTAGPWFVQEGMLDGGTFALSAGVRRRIRHSREGLWPNSAGTKPTAVLEIEAYDAGDPGSGTGQLWMSQGLFLTTLLTSTNKLTLRIPAATTADGYIGLGTLMIGRACALAREYGWGHAREVQTAVSLRTLRGGARRARQLAAPRHAIEIDWSYGVDLTGLYTATAPSWVSIYTGGSPHGSLPSTLPLVAGLIGELGGSVTPGVICTRVPTQGSAPTATAPIRVLDPTALLYGRVMTETWRRDNVLGEEGTDTGEMVRGGTIRLEQDL